MTILELREKRNTAWNVAKAFLDSHRTEKGTLTAEDDATYSRMEQEIADLGKEIARLERQEALESELNKPVNKPLTSKPGNSANDKPKKTGRASDEYKNGMLQALRTNFRQVSNILQEGVDADGGYLVPEEYDNHTSAYAPENAIAFGDYSYYNIGDRGTRSFKQLTELFAGNGMIGYVAKERVDGKLILPEAVQILKLSGSSKG